MKILSECFIKYGTVVCLYFKTLNTANQQDFFSYGIRGCRVCNVHSFDFTSYRTTCVFFGDINKVCTTTNNKTARQFKNIIITKSLAHHSTNSDGNNIMKYKHTKIFPLMVFCYLFI